MFEIFQATDPNYHFRYLRIKELLWEVGEVGMGRPKEAETLIYWQDGHDRAEGGIWLEAYEGRYVLKNIVFYLIKNPQSFKENSGQETEMKALMHQFYGGFFQMVKDLCEERGGLSIRLEALPNQKFSSLDNKLQDHVSASIREGERLVVKC